MKLFLLASLVLFTATAPVAAQLEAVMIPGGGGGLQADLWVQPNGTAPVYIQIYDGDVPIPNLTFEVGTIGVYPQMGGHDTGHSGWGWGYLTPHSATTGPNGESALFQWEAGPAAGIAWPSLYFTYYGQEYLITTRNGMVIGHTFDDMPYLGDGDGFVRIGETSRHPINHYGENWFLDRLRQLASEYRARWGLTLAYNDISLRRGASSTSTAISADRTTSIVKAMTPMFVRTLRSMRFRTIPKFADGSKSACSSCLVVPHSSRARAPQTSITTSSALRRCKHGASKGTFLSFVLLSTTTLAQQRPEVQFDPASGEYKIRYTFEGQNQEIAFVPATQVAPDVRVEVRRQDDGAFHYLYRVSNGPRARQQLSSFAITGVSIATQDSPPPEWESGSVASRARVYWHHRVSGDRRGLPPGAFQSGFGVVSSMLPGPTRPN
jgi:hypothetical protein